MIARKKYDVFGKEELCVTYPELSIMVSGTKRASVVTGLTKIGQSLILNGEATIENVGEKVREFVKAKFGDKFNFDDFATDFDLAMLPEESSNKLRIPNSYIRDLVEGGIDTIEDLVKAIQKDYGGTDREVRDAITGYGKTFKPRDEIANEITRLKDIGRMISALEDIEQGKRPLKSGQQREAPTLEQREMRKKVREALKDLGIDEATMEKQLKTALDAAKTRLRNQIEDMEAEIAKGEQVPKSARTMRSDEELEKLKRERDAKKKEYDEKFKDEAYEETAKTMFTKSLCTFNFIQGYMNIQLKSVAEYSTFLNRLELIDKKDKNWLFEFEHNNF